MAKLTRAEIREGLTQIPIDVLLVGNNKNVQLTSKEEKFVKGLVEGKPKAQSYRKHITPNPLNRDKLPMHLNWQKNQRLPNV